MDNQTKPTQVGMNRTGVASSPIDVKSMVEEARRAGAGQPANGHAVEAERLRWAQGAEPLGTMPPPASVKGAVKTAMEGMKGKHANVFLDLLGERLAFERAGTRLYEALLVKHGAAGTHPRGPSREDLERIRDDELAHFGLLKRALEELGADPTVVTPAADVVAVAGAGWVQALSDPRTTLTEGLKIVLQAELTDNDGWLTLSDLAARLGHDALAERFRGALLEEEQHLARVRAWVLGALEGQVGLSPEEGEPASTAPAP